MDVQVQNIWQQRGWVQKQEQVQKSDRIDSRTAGLKETGANRSRVFEEKTWADRGFGRNRRAQVAGFWRKDACGPRVWKKQAHLGRGFLEKRRGWTAGLEETGTVR